MVRLNKKIGRSRRILANLDKSYAADIERLKKEKGSEDEIGQTEAAWSGERQTEEFELDSLLTRKMLSEAENFDVPLPARPVYSEKDRDWDENEHWYRNPMDGSFSLTQRGRDYLDDAIWKKQERKYNRWARWVTLTIGLTGALT